MNRRRRLTVVLGGAAAAAVGATLFATLGGGNSERVVFLPAQAYASPVSKWPAYPSFPGSSCFVGASTGSPVMRYAPSYLRRRLA